MFTDILFIITTGFALFGVYCMIETISDMFAVRNFPSTVTVFTDEDDEITYRKIKYVEQNIPNNHIYIYSDTAGKADNMRENFEDIIKNVLCVNNK